MKRLLARPNPSAARHPSAVRHLLAAIGVCVCAAAAHGADHPIASQATGCPGEDAGLSLPAGFCASIFADGIGHARHLVVSPDGVVYANTWSGRYYGNTTPHDGGFLVALKDTTGSGKADVNERFGETVQSGGHGGTGIAYYKGYLYAESNDKIVKYRITPGAVVPSTRNRSRS
jgi:glucose/arabinose dehydrogenase